MICVSQGSIKRQKWHQLLTQSEFNQELFIRHWKTDRDTHTKGYEAFTEAATVAVTILKAKGTREEVKIIQMKATGGRPSLVLVL